MSDVLDKARHLGAQADAEIQALKQRINELEAALRQIANSTALDDEAKLVARKALERK